ncbi:hypothetical protein B0H14DRAFT_2858269 [Mycena olivaceomarginata]|nr:hypothetical protein B0H14DRAFT_2858269 [Mycena olivaceomarginata]
MGFRSGAYLPFLSLPLAPYPLPPITSLPPSPSPSAMRQPPLPVPLQSSRSRSPTSPCSPRPSPAHFLAHLTSSPPRMNALLPSACMGTFVGTLHTILKLFLLRRMTADIFPGAWFLSLCLLSWFPSGVGFGTPCWVCSFVKWAGPC